VCLSVKVYFERVANGQSKRERERENEAVVCCECGVRFEAKLRPKSRVKRSSEAFESTKHCRCARLSVPLCGCKSWSWCWI
jgi:hypothetical protein